MKKQSIKQQKIYEYIMEHVSQFGYPPTVREIGEAVGLRSPSTVHFHLRALEMAGLIVKDAGKTRAITVNVCPDGALPEGKTQTAAKFQDRSADPGRVRPAAKGGRDETIAHWEAEPNIGLPKNKIPLLGQVMAGKPILAQELVEDYLAFDTAGPPEEYFALCVQGDSMIHAGILPGDLLVVRRQHIARHGEIVIALLEDKATVKRLYRKDGEILLLPENDDYDPIDGSHAEILGKVEGVVRRY
ncbi:MAG: transcriptional repressor LexA [Oscillospiraceae bacterium]|nr:transcriptional repressor LexA [Oscillospiraceae bacterium]